MIFAAIMFAVAAALFLIASGLAFAAGGATFWYELVAAAVFAAAALFSYQTWAQKKKANAK